MSLSGKTILITGAARRIGRALSIAVARAGGNVILHHNQSPHEAEETRAAVESYGGKAAVIEADFRDPYQAAHLVQKALAFGPLYGLVNNASIFEPLTILTTSLEDWERHMTINLTAPFLLSQSFAAAVGPEMNGRIVNILDWRALRPGKDHLPYTISKAGLAALTHSLAASLAPNITVNGLALGAILPPSTGELSDSIIKNVPARRWAEPGEVEEAFLFLLAGPSYVTGEIIHIDGGRHLI